MKKRILIFLFVILSFISIFIGVHDIGIMDIIKGNTDKLNILFLTRVPRLISIIIAAVAMSIAGVIMQQISNNKFVSPTTAATVDSAMFGVLISMLIFQKTTLIQKMFMGFIFALIGTFLFMTMLNKIKIKNIIFIPLVGIMLGNVIGSITGGAIAFSSMIFQTVTNNRILTPSILGLDSLYMLGQTILIFLFGSSSIMMTNRKINFLFSLIIMITGTVILYKTIFKRRNNIFFLLLVGTVIGTLLKSMTSFMQVLIDPNEFLTLQSKMFANFNNVNTDILLISIIIILIIFAVIYDDIKKLDVMLLGRENAINLGIDYDKFTKKILLVVSILVSISTALVGPVTFLGLLVVNLTYQYFKTYKHQCLIVGAILIGIIALLGGQILVERVFNFSSTVSIIINFIGGIYFIYLLLKEARA